MAFYALLGLIETRRYDSEAGRFTNVFMAPPDQRECPLELTYNWGTESYDLGNAYGHIAIGVEDIYAVCEELEKAGADVYRKPGPVLGGDTVIAFVRDPDGYAVELIECKE